jgi:hypothetical protein
MSLGKVAALLEPARVEVEATAAVPPPELPA